MNISHREGVVVIQLTGGSATQSFSREFLPKIRDAILDHIGCKAIVITGEGKFFSAGADILAFQKSIEDGDSVELIRELTGILHPLLLKMRTSETIFVAALNGASAGGGLGLALACDVRIASNNAKMAASYSGIGLSPDGGTTWLLPRLVGEQSARCFFLENQVWNAEEALTKGAIDQIVPEEVLIDKSVLIAQKWSQWSKHTKEATKHLLLTQNVNDFETHLKHERTLIEAAGLTSEFAEGVDAFINKRNPNFNSD
ncbi:MAG: enoyl-CoA hydratase/isomerase family protein [Candidatus Poseidoniaceae archaeon]|jgi:2-(1,2-epoxy-1,2-dihydrophenyl)acetyl-CoA isomerase|nr:enoyl-CoA hydratase/isomerase family protein [Candidatus Poseidoniaceae archaeon]